MKSMRSSKNGRMQEAVERKLGHVTLATNRTQILHSLYGFKMVTNSNMLTCSARFLRLSVVKGGC